jgi:hypothetical protein
MNNMHFGRIRFKTIRLILSGEFTIIAWNTFEEENCSKYI